MVRLPTSERLPLASSLILPSLLVSTAGSPTRFSTRRASEFRGCTLIRELPSSLSPQIKPIRKATLGEFLSSIVSFLVPFRNSPALASFSLSLSTGTTSSTHSLQIVMDQQPQHPPTQLISSSPKPSPLPPPPPPPTRQLSKSSTSLKPPPSRIWQSTPSTPPPPPSLDSSSSTSEPKSSTSRCPALLKGRRSRG